MCGRFALYTDPLALAKRFQTENSVHLPPSYNVAPSQFIPIVRDENSKRLFALARWGLIPSWAKDVKIGYNTINARAETVAEKPAFRSAFKYRRCLIPADGYYEWQELANSKTKQPWYITRKDRQPMALAGLWEHWQGQDGSEIESCTIIVTSGNELMVNIHDRMPVILPEASWDIWLDTGNTDKQVLQNLLIPYPHQEMTAWRVSALVNRPGYNKDESIRPLD